MSFPKLKIPGIYGFYKNIINIHLFLALFEMGQQISVTKFTHRDDFQSSDGWLDDKNKNRFSLRLLSMTGEKTAIRC